MPKKNPELDLLRDKIESMVKADPTLSVDAVVKLTGCKKHFVYRVGRDRRLKFATAKGATRDGSSTARVAEYYRQNPNSSRAACAQALGLKPNYVSIICTKLGLARKDPLADSKAAELAFELQAALMDLKYLQQGIEQDEPKPKLLRRVRELHELFSEATGRLAQPATPTTEDSNGISPV